MWQNKAQKSRLKMNSQNYLKSYPYLFVRESDQTDYFCTLCDTYLKEEDLQQHLFEDHRAEKMKDCFVLVATGSGSGSGDNEATKLYICVVCWAKISNFQELVAHRRECRVEEDDEETDTDNVKINATL